MPDSRTGSRPAGRPLLHAPDNRSATRLPVARIGHAEDRAPGAMYLMANGYVTAQVLGIDGGQEVMD